jgi:hypothetical protein
VVTVPNGVNAVMRRNLKQLGEAGFHALAKMIVDNLRPFLLAHKGAMPCCRGLQRRYPSQKTVPYI